MFREQVIKIYIYNLKNRPFALKELKISFNHVKLNITVETASGGKGFKLLLITINDASSVKFQPKRQVLFPNLFDFLKSKVICK